MSVLSKETILEKARGAEKLLGENFKLENVQGSSYDLRIGAIYKSPSKHDVEKKYISITNGDPESLIIDLVPSEIVVMLTLEEVNIPNNICATVFPINKQSSRGLLILNSGHIDPGYKGPISICAINLSNETIRIKLNENIFTIIFTSLDNNTLPYENKKLTRVELETDFYVNKASKLSSSIFDLLTINKSEPFLREQVDKVLTERRSNRWKKWTQPIPIIGAILAILVIFFITIPTSFVTNKHTEKLETQVDSLTKQSIKLDSITKEIIKKQKADSIKNANDKK